MAYSFVVGLRESPPPPIEIIHLTERSGTPVLSKGVKLLGEHEEESSQKITELEAMCKRLREDAQKLKEEKTTLEGMI
jgi:hypothetical protein